MLPDDGIYAAIRADRRTAHVLDPTADLLGGENFQTIKAAALRITF